MRISSRRLGEFLVTRRVLSRDVLDELLAREAAEGVHLSNLLVADQLVSERDLMAAVASELNVPYVDLGEQSILPDVWGIVSEDFARGYLAVATERTSDGMRVVMEDPGDEQAVAALEEDLGLKVFPAVAVRDELQHLIDVMYGRRDTADDDWAEGDLDGGSGSGVSGIRPAERQLADLLERALAVGGSDLHLAVGSPPMVRVQGELRRLDEGQPLNGSEVRRLVLDVLTQGQRDRFLAEGELSTSHAIPGQGRFRVSAFVQRDSVGAVLRVIPGEIPSPADLGLPSVIEHWAEQRAGLILVCGPHGSGTSTTLAALVDKINRSRACHILTIEEPIEFLHRHRMGLVNQREVGEDTASFATGMRHAMRQDPDVVVVGELPDLETTRLALAASETGQLVLATLRTMDAVQTVERLVETFPPDHQQRARNQLAANLLGIVVQQLVPALDGGVALATEILVPDPEVVRCIRAGDSVSLSKAMLAGAGGDMGTMDQSLAGLVQAGHVGREVALDRAVEAAEVRYLLSSDGRR